MHILFISGASDFIRMNILGQHVNPQEFTWVYYPLIRKCPRSSQTMKQCLTNSSLNRYLRKLESQSFNWFLGKIKGKLYNHCLPSPKVVGTFSPQLSQVQQQCLTFDIDLCQHYYTSLELDNFWRLSLWILQVRWNILVFYSAFFVFPALECIHELVEIWEHKCADDCLFRGSFLCSALISLIGGWRRLRHSHQLDDWVDQGFLSTFYYSGFQCRVLINM